MTKKITPTRTGVTEHGEQQALFEWAAMMANTGRYPGIELLFAIPNGGHRHKAVARKMQEEGVKAGVPDIFLPVPRNGIPGMFIELKVGENRPTVIQKAWQRWLQAQGYYVVTCWGFEQARDEIIAYLEYGHG